MTDNLYISFRNLPERYCCLGKKWKRWFSWKMFVRCYFYPFINLIQYLIQFNTTKLSGKSCSQFFKSLDSGSKWQKWQKYLSIFFPCSFPCVDCDNFDNIQMLLLKKPYRGKIFLVLFIINV